MARSERVTALAGGLLGVALGIALAYVVLQDRERRLDAAERRAEAVAYGIERLLSYEMRNLERAMLGIAGDADQLFATVPGQAPGLLSRAVAGVVARHGELDSIVLVDPRGRALTDGRGDPDFAAWIGQARRATGSALRFGHMERGPHDEWLLPLALPMRDDRWILARLRSAELQRAVSGLDSGERGVAMLLDHDGRILAQDLDPQRHVGTYMAGYASAELLRSGATLRGETRPDGVPRIVARRAFDGYPLAVAVGLAEREVLAAWRPFAGWALASYAGYWLGLLVLVGTMRRADRTQATLLHELREGTGRLRRAQRLGGTGSWELARDSRTLVWEEQVAEIVGLPADRREIGVDEFLDMVHPEDRARVAGLFSEAREGGDPLGADYRVLRPDGSVRWIASHGAVTAGPDGIPRLTGTVVDITGRMQAQLALADAERQFRLMFERNPLPFWVLDATSKRFVEVNEAAIAHYGYPRGRFLEMSLADIEVPAEAPTAPAVALCDAYGDSQIRTHRKRDGTRIEVCTHSAAIEFQGREALLVLAEDVSRRMAWERTLAYRATHDDHTGLLTLTALAERLDLEPGEGYEIFSVQFPGLDLIRDTLGREASDAIVRAVAERLDWLARRYGLAAHLPPGTFVLAVRGEGGQERALNELCASLAEPVRGGATVHHLEARIGVARHPADGERADKVIGNAALAAHLVERGGTEVARYVPAMSEEVGQRLAMTARLRRAIERHEFRLHFQPIRQLRDSAAVAIECLLRWPQPDGGFVPPLSFIPLCERSGLIVELGRWVLREAAATAARLAAEGRGDIAVAVNVSAGQFDRRDLAGEIERLADEFALRRGALHVELTESVLLERPEQAMDTLRRLQRQGVRVALDDFGTGYSSMSYLNDLPVDTLKLDRMFVARVDVDARSAAICRALIALGHSVGLTIVAEGVEHEGQHRWLRENGCDQAQGFLFDRPRPFEETFAALGAGRGQGRIGDAQGR
ncbi:EAL domain-containing protein [Luteimonas sp. RD2P54]|uniref:EAL domain-containing protein n=1 Tax=Luteimonas endophytica TaxID=3042023 RepID=A0ABT6JC29_9GAMM|nr:EAL domain-containing protein [Luteimonas endophytica]MDH5823733.1 EAL domain-containing protein [Luteimonas endophytica]